MTKPPSLKNMHVPCAVNVRYKPEGNLQKLNITDNFSYTFKQVKPLMLL